jgi:hypothetical protein
LFSAQVCGGVLILNLMMAFSFFLAMVELLRIDYGCVMALIVIFEAAICMLLLAKSCVMLNCIKVYRFVHQDWQVIVFFVFRSEDVFSTTNK